MQRLVVPIHVNSAEKMSAWNVTGMIWMFVGSVMLVYIGWIMNVCTSALMDTLKMGPTAHHAIAIAPNVMETLPHALNAHPVCICTILSVETALRAILATSPHGNVGIVLYIVSMLISKCM
jgi:hypothetical protein